MSLPSRQPLDVSALLSPRFAKSIESGPGGSDPVAFPLDIFKLDVSAYLGQFGAVLAGAAPLRSVGEGPNGCLNGGVLPRKQNPSLAVAQAELKRKVQAPVASRFGFTKD
jgi:hypothetical protein